MKIVSLAYMQLSTHKIWVVGMLIYILCTAIGICFNNDFKSPPLTYNTTFLNPGGGVGGSNEAVPDQSQFSSSFEVEEDDDDSDRSFFIAFANRTRSTDVRSGHSSNYYQQIGLDIITPPPRRV